MTTWRLVASSLWHYRRSHVAALLGVVVATAAIGGALVVGDSLRTSLKRITLERLQGVDFVVNGPRFFREELASQLDLSAHPGLAAAPVLQLTAGLEATRAGRIRRASRVSVFGLSAEAARLARFDDWTDARGVTLNRLVAQELDVREGDSVSLWLELPSAIPRDSLLGKRDGDTVQLTLPVVNVLDDDAGPARLSMELSQTEPRAAFAPLAVLQQALDLQPIAATRRDPRERPALVNAIWLGEPASPSRASGESISRADVDREERRALLAILESSQLTQTIAKAWSLADWNLRVTSQEDGVFALESDMLILPGRISNLASEIARDQGLSTSSVFIYLANRLQKSPPSESKKAYSRYSTVAALDVTTTTAPFGPFEFIAGSAKPLNDDEIVINEWLATDLEAALGDRISLDYHVVGSYGELPEARAEFTIAGIVKLAGPAADRGMTPAVKGITDVDSVADWDQPFPMDLENVTSRDEDYWDEFRATPKAFLSPARAKSLWPNRFGTLTSLRMAPPPESDSQAAVANFTAALMSRLQPGEGGFHVRAVKAMGLRASAGSTDFTGLFIGFSLFLIIAAVLLVGLLVRLAWEQRTAEVGLLGAVGWSRGAIGRLLAAEAAVVLGLGSIGGCAAAVAYAQGVMRLLTTRWIGAVGTQRLSLDVRPATLATGALVAVACGFLAVRPALRTWNRTSIRGQLRGAVHFDDASTVALRRSRRRASVLFVVCASLAIAGAAAGLIGAIPTGDAAPGLAWSALVFFSVGMLALAAGVLAFSVWLRRDGSSLAGYSGRGGLAGALALAVRNARRHRSRSVLSTAMISGATFVIVAVAAGRIDPMGERPDRQSGNGGYLLVGETSSPLLFDLNSAAGRDSLGFRTPPPEVSQLASPTDDANRSAPRRISAFRVQPGQDASCLNLFQASLPTILGVPNSFLERGGFRFAGSSDPHIWNALHATESDGAIPVFGDMNTLMFSLKKGIGDAIPAASASRPELKFRVRGMLANSVFQGVLLMSEENFRALYPEQAGYRYFLVDAPPESAEATTDWLETELAPYGADVELVSRRLARFLAVQNTYLSTFQTLGGLGLLTGVFGLTAVMLRNVFERRAEIGLLRAIGFSSSRVAWLVLFENMLLLGWGLTTGTLSALLAMAPHLVSTGANAPWTSGVLQLMLVVVAGLCSALAAVRSATSIPLVPALRSD